MGCCNDSSVALASPAADPALHVNYTKGMVLGVDDYTQEFAYLSGRNQRTVREMLGYGTTSGLAVSLDDSADGPRVHVMPGAAAVPSGKQVCVPAEQCGLLNQWLAKPENAAKVGALVNPASSPPQSLSLYLTLCYADCTTLPVPIPGDPCRSEDQLMADSRIADDYRLELRTEPPKQAEEDALRDFIAWLKQVPVVDASPPPAADEKTWIAGLKAAAQPWFDVLAESPPASPPAPLTDYMFDSPPTALVVGRGQFAAFLKVAFRFWVTDLRPLWMARACAASPQADDDCLLLARLTVPLVWVGGVPTGAWQVAGHAADIAVDQSSRPFLVDLRLLQAWQGSGLEPESYAPPPATGGLPALAAAFSVPVGDGTAWVAKPLQGTPNQVFVNSAGPQLRLSLPQDIATTSSPSFAGLTATGKVTVKDMQASGQMTVAGAITANSLTAAGGIRTPNLVITHGLRVPVISTVEAKMELTGDHYCVVCNGAAAQKLDLPKAEGSNQGRVYCLKNQISPPADVTVAVAALSSDTIDGAAAYTISKGGTVTLVSGGHGQWYVIARV